MEGKGTAICVVLLVNDVSKSGGRAPLAPRAAAAVDKSIMHDASLDGVALHLLGLRVFFSAKLDEKATLNIDMLGESSPAYPFHM